MQFILPGWSCLDNYSHAELGRIWVLYNAGISISMLSCVAHALHCHIYSLKLQRYFLLSVIYASNNDIERRSLWQELTEIHASMLAVPWLLIGDFNVIKIMGERSDFSWYVLSIIYSRVP